MPTQNSGPAPEHLLTEQDEVYSSLALQNRSDHHVASDGDQRIGFLRGGSTATEFETQVPEPRPRRTGRRGRICRCGGRCRDAPARRSARLRGVVVGAGPTACDPRASRCLLAACAGPGRVGADAGPPRSALPRVSGPRCSLVGDSSSRRCHLVTRSLRRGGGRRGGVGFRRRRVRQLLRGPSRLSTSALAVRGRQVAETPTCARPELGTLTPATKLSLL